MLSGLGLLVTPDAIIVLVFPGETVVVCALLTLETHVLLLVGIGQTILEHAVDERLVAKLGTGAHSGEVVRGVGHGLCATSDDNVGGAGQDSLSANDDGLDTRGADLVHGGANGRLLEASA